MDMAMAVASGANWITKAWNTRLKAVMEMPQSTQCSNVVSVVNEARCNNNKKRVIPYTATWMKATAYLSYIFVNTMLPKIPAAPKRVKMNVIRLLGRCATCPIKGSI